MVERGRTLMVKRKGVDCLPGIGYPENARGTRCLLMTASFRLDGGGLGLVALPVFKTGGPAKSGPVGSIPTRLRHLS